MNITLEQAYTGTIIPVQITRFISNNNKIINENETIYIDIIQGSDNNEIIILNNKGNIVNNKTGLIKIILNVINTTEFDRNGLDLFYNKNITLKEALCGFNFTLTLLNNKTYNIINYDNIIQPNTKKIIPNMGMTRSGVTGSLYIKFNILFPKNININVVEFLKLHL